MNTDRIYTILTRFATVAMQRAFGEAAAQSSPDLRATTDPRFGDYQINGILPLAKVLKKNPRELATEFVAQWDSDGLTLPPEVAGPGFINLRLNDARLGTWLGRAAQDARVGVAPVAQPQSVVVDFSGPNVAKRMHVGHLRSTVIGDAIIRTLRFLGHKVVGDNHVGDWGTQFGILLWAWKGQRDEAAFEKDPIGELERLYKAGSEAMRADEAVAEACRAELVALQAGDPTNKALWETFVAVSRKEAETVYDRLEVEFDTWHGESFYHPMLAPLVARFREAGIASESEGAICIFLDEPGLPETPFIIQKSDGAFLYATTDLATLRYRLDEYQADRVIYVVDVRQSDHFKQLFASARKAGWQGEFVHVGFGMMLGADGRPFKTRSGETIRLEALLDEARARILPLVQEKWADASLEEQEEIAQKVGSGAVKYADLAQHRTTDYKFDWEKLMASDGNTGPYLQYALVRCLSVLRTHEDRDGEPFIPSGAPITLREPEERALGIELMRFGEVLDKVSEHLLPHYLCEYLYQLARHFNAFYAKHTILDDVNARRDRLSLTYMTWQTLELGLNCLNIPRVHRM